MKSKYRIQIRDLASINDAATVKKERFIQCYYNALLQALSERNIRAGWRATGISPYNPAAVLASSQINDRTVTPPPPADRTQPPDAIYQAPQRSQDVYAAYQSLLQVETLSRSVRTVITKASKAISKANTRAAGLEAENRCLKQQLADLQPQKKRNRVEIDPNQRFADVEQIMSAINQAAEEDAEEAICPVRKQAVKAAQEATQASFENMCTQWQL